MFSFHETIALDDAGAIAAVYRVDGPLAATGTATRADVVDGETHLGLLSMGDGHAKLGAIIVEEGKLRTETGYFPLGKGGRCVTLMKRKSRERNQGTRYLDSNSIIRHGIQSVRLRH